MPRNPSTVPKKGGEGRSDRIELFTFEISKGHLFQCEGDGGKLFDFKPPMVVCGVNAG
jgi:hypothetical protein